mmetsp:Transcript_12095/g.15833  ORF Transcript_12095/g.15833 Transcript_12095/m.15833 type:complete len:120 (-) Transcript_12095:653-1012(-)|eukprot:CAMPEP_0198139276 /NCGR_PEP_ID=MMETSP1443-20131203/2614_1 /TAXON_ID=186043 /ORGANISM="Entomoneis sp., Strain CCMP2396" /LENGTH=119 /DNA_ID=CAMNT_0043801365 /DNA_START=214 /DNA_END=573 /DNA_ORIENTATION=+
MRFVLLVPIFTLLLSTCVLPTGVLAGEDADETDSLAALKEKMKEMRKEEAITGNLIDHAALLKTKLAQVEEQLRSVENDEQAKRVLENSVKLLKRKLNILSQVPQGEGRGHTMEEFEEF